MVRKIAQFWQKCLIEADHFLMHPVVLGTFPAICLGLFWLFGEKALMASAIVLPLVVILFSALRRTGGAYTHNAATGLMHRDSFDRWVQNAIEKCENPEFFSALFTIELDEHDLLLDRYGKSAVDEILLQTGHRIAATFRATDAVTRLGDYSFSVCLCPIRKFDLETCVQLSGRMQQAIEEPVSVDGEAIYVTSSIGFCQSSRMTSTQKKDWIDASNIALRDAQFHGPAAIRAYSDEMRLRRETLAELREEVANALENGQIQPWYQPQISTDTGLVTGFEALARWYHPTRGMVAPGEFLPAIDEAGLLERLAEIMLENAFGALKAWDAAGVVVPQVGVNFAGPELSNPKLIDKIAWQLDRFDLTADRLAVEVLETVVASTPDDVVARNINGLSKMGCKIDLDDFGTGHASITSIRRFSVNRIKIDRSFVMKADRDPEQQRMIGAILTMAERMDVETLAEGVETAGEHNLLAQLGCNHVQGFGIAKPMPFEETIEWMAMHNAKLADTPRIMGNGSR